MRSFRFALMLAGGLMLHGCASHSAKETYTQDEIVNSIMKNRSELSCPSSTVRICEGSGGNMMRCSCVQQGSLRHMLTGSF